MLNSVSVVSFVPSTVARVIEVEPFLDGDGYMVRVVSNTTGIEYGIDLNYDEQNTFAAFIDDRCICVLESNPDVVRQGVINAIRVMDEFAVANGWQLPQEEKTVEVLPENVPEEFKAMLGL